MGIGPEQRQYISGTLKKAIANFYGDKVPTLSDFIKRRRATFMTMLEDKVNATEWRQKIADAREKRGRAQAVVTRYGNEHQAKMTELRAKHEKEKAELNAKQQKEFSDLALHYETPTAEAKEALRQRENELDALNRKSYFSGLGEEDDSRSLRYDVQGSDYYIDAAIKSRVDGFVENNLGNDEDGKAVQKRIEEETLISDAAYIAKDMKDLRELVLGFIENKELPPITVKAWLIVDGNDVIKKE